MHVYRVASSQVRDAEATQKTSRILLDPNDLEKSFISLRATKRTEIKRTSLVLSPGYDDVPQEWPVSQRRL